MKEKSTYYIKENSWIAYLASVQLQTRQVAIVIGHTIHLHNTAKESFLMNEKWLKHELCHIKQYEQYGKMGFIARYLYESIKKGYYHNKYEVEAREAELS